MSSKQLPPIKNSEGSKRNAKLHSLTLIGQFQNDIEPANTKQADESTKKRFKSFKQVVNVMTMNYKWTKNAKNEEVQDDKSRNFGGPKEKEERLTFNVSGEYIYIYT